MLGRVQATNNRAAIMYRILFILVMRWVGDAVSRWVKKISFLLSQLSFIHYLCKDNEYTMTKQEQLDKRYMRMAYVWAENSYCERRKVGAILVKNRMIISDGYNGTPCGFENICEDDNFKTKPYVLHAEANAITKIARSHNSSEGATMYVTTSPCIECAKLIIQAGIIRVVYCDEYHVTDGLDLLKRAGIEVCRIEMNQHEQ